MLLQTVSDPANPNYEHCAENAERLRAAGIEVVELDLAALRARRTPSCPYINFYVCNGAVIVPVSDPETDDEALDAARRRSTPAARRSACPGARSPTGGGGVHCITQQVPAV